MKPILHSITAAVLTALALTYATPTFADSHRIRAYFEREYVFNDQYDYRPYSTYRQDRQDRQVRAESRSRTSISRGDDQLSSNDQLIRASFTQSYAGARNSSRVLDDDDDDDDGRYYRKSSYPGYQDGRRLADASSGEVSGYDAYAYRPHFRRHTFRHSSFRRPHLSSHFYYGGNAFYYPNTYYYEVPYAFAGYGYARYGYNAYAYDTGYGGYGAYAVYYVDTRPSYDYYCPYGYSYFECSAVIMYGRVAGLDPDLSIRSQMRRDSWPAAN